MQANGNPARAELRARRVRAVVDMVGIEEWIRRAAVSWVVGPTGWPLAEKAIHLMGTATVAVLLTLGVLATSAVAVWALGLVDQVRRTASLAPTPAHGRKRKRRGGRRR